MEYVNHTNFHFQNTAVSLGKFDGIHIGHQSLINGILSYKEKGLKTVVFSFLVHPEILLGGKEIFLIATETEKKKKLEKMGIDVLVSYPFSKQMLSMKAEQFIKEILVEKLDVKVIVVGDDFHFGYKREGDIHLLEKFSSQYGYKVITADNVMSNGKRISSTRIREAIEKGNMELVQTLLGEPYNITGEVVHGRAIGRTIGVPTANVIPDRKKLLPPFGVYVSKTLVDGIWYEGITNIGIQPTVTEEKIKLVETFLFDFEGNLYGKEIQTNLYYFKRLEQKFASLDEIKEQLKKDCVFAREYLEKQKS